MAVADDTDQLDKAIRQTIKTFKEVSAMQVWTWVLNREGNLLTLEERLEELVRAGKLRRISNSFPPAYAMGKWR